MSNYDFMVVCHGRSGSHFFASLLDSHPEICCLGEYANHTHTKSECVGWNKQGRIFMYGAFLNKNPDSFAPKAIHLVRNVDKTAFSCVRNTTLRKALGKDHLAHVRGGQQRQRTTKNFRASKHAMDNRKKEIIASRHRAIQELIDRKVEVLDIRYENLTQGNKSVSKMPDYMNKIITDFLGVKPFKFTTDMVKVAADEIKIDWSIA